MGVFRRSENNLGHSYHDAGCHLNCIHSKLDWHLENKRIGSMTERVTAAGLKVAQVLYDFIGEQVLPDLGLSADAYWAGLATILNEFVPRNTALLEERDTLQVKLDEWYKRRGGKPIDPDEYRAFLLDVGYILPEVGDFAISTANVDSEVAQIAGPQLVVPIMNARFALNAANARWGSLYDALYGTDVIPENAGEEKGRSYNPVRGDKVIEYAVKFLNAHVGLKGAEHQAVSRYFVEHGRLLVDLVDGKVCGLAAPDQFVGYCGEAAQPSAVLLIHNNLHIEIQIDRTDDVGKHQPAGVKDVVMESAVTTIQDCEDSVAAVDAEDKALVYSNWLGLMRGTLSEEFKKDGVNVQRTLNPDRVYNSAQGGEIVIPGRSLLLIRNVGHLMTSEAVLLPDGSEIPEGILDGFITSTIAMYDLNGSSRVQNSRTGSVYIVKPKMHGPDEVSFTVDLFSRIESMLGLPLNTLKIGIMDEERRTTLNLKACIERAKERVIFVNTGFLDRTGDEIHTSMEAGPMVPKTVMKQQAWIGAYEDWNVDIGLATGFSGHAQIGKGMWPMPDEMAEMMQVKVGHPEAGANCAWVPSPTAATLHAIHYHDVSVVDRQDRLRQRSDADLATLLELPLLRGENLTSAQVTRELENNAQGILGYVVRWIDQGIGCSKVPDINNVGLMEDRATLRISSQHIANWLHHGICSEGEVLAVMKKMAVVVDEQNGDDESYRAMSNDFEKSIAFQAACELVFEGKQQPNGYTEPVLHLRRRQAKSQMS